MYRPNARSPSITSQESYSAVMITDLIADVPVHGETEEAEKSTKEATNLGYDGQLDGDTQSPSVDDTSQKTNGAGQISKGVLLNAVQFGQNDSKGDEKPIQLAAVLPVPTLTQKTPKPKGFKDMTLTRKIAFIFSFLPSILFVLCFAIILPCNVPPPCIDTIWTRTFNHTEATSGLEIPENIVFTAFKQGESVLVHVNKAFGRFNEVHLGGNSSYLKCGKIMNKKRIDCIILDENGDLYSFNESHSRNIWSPVSEEDEYASNPIILSGCTDDEEDAVSLAVSSTKMKVLYSGNKVSTFNITDCDTVPTKLMPWVVNGSSNIVFICEKDGEERLISVPKSMWCTYSNDPKEKSVILKSGASGSFNETVLHPLNDGLVLWSGDEVAMIQPNGTYLWKISNLSHAEENRFILYGKFSDEKKQIALISSDLVSGLKVTLLDPSSGHTIKFISPSDFEANQIIHVEGKKRDYILLLLKKPEKDIVTAALTQINDISTTIVNLVSDKEVNNAVLTPAAEELGLLDFDGSITSIADFKGEEKNPYKRDITVSATNEKDTSVLNIYILSTYINPQMKITEIRNIDVRNWDKSVKSRCKI